MPTLHTHAARDHHVCELALQQDPAAYRSLWEALQGVGEPVEDSFAEALMWSCPESLATAMNNGGTAAAYALSVVWPMREQAAASLPFELRELAREAWAAVQERADQADDVRYGLGCDESESWECTRDPRMHSRGLHKVREIAKLAGRIFAQLQGERATQVKAVPEEVYSVERGNAIARILPGELSALGTPLEPVFWKNFADRKCMQYALRGTSEAGRGPLVICLDESGSMHDGRQRWSKAAAVAMIRTAWTDKRRCAVVHFATSMTVTYLEPGDTRSLLAVINHWLSGGTCIAKALKRSASLIKELSAKGDKGADVILTTDGVEKANDAEHSKAIDAEHSKAIDAVEDAGAVMYTVAIECEIAKDKALRSRARRYAHLDNSQLQSGDVTGIKDAVL